jgi:hypothetical protein
MRLTIIRAGTAMVVLALASPGALPRAVEPIDAVAREYTIYNDYIAAVPPVDAIAREYTIYNDFLVRVFPQDAIAREYTIYNDFRVPVPPGDAVTREYTIYRPPYEVADVNRALTIAAGLIIATRANLDRLNEVRDGESATKVDMRDAARIARMAMGLDP